MTHYNEIKNVIDGMKEYDKKIVIEIVDSISITSSVIGYLSKLVNVDGVTIELHAGDDNLYGLLDELGLIQLFNVRKIS